MGALIESWATVADRRKGALALADAAIADCLARAGREAADVELLINAGVYRDENLGEPALAALIQDDIGASSRKTRHTAHGTFSFDAGNGGGGVLTAIHLADGFLADSVDLALIVASDAHPGTAVTPRFPFSSVGGALLLVPGDPDFGFVGFRFDDYPEHAALFSAHIDWEKRRLRRGHNVLVIEEQPHYAARAVDCAAESIRRFMGPRLRDIDLVVPSPLPGDFPDALSRRLELPDDRIARAGEAHAGAHTAGLIAAFEAAERSGRLAESKQILFVGVGAGISVGLALYVRPDRA